MTDLHDNRVYRHTVSLGDFEMEIEYSDAVWDDIEWPQMALEISGANYHEQIRGSAKVSVMARPSCGCPAGRSRTG